MARTTYTRSNRAKNGVEPSQRATQNTQNGRDESESESEGEVGGTQAENGVVDRDVGDLFNTPSHMPLYNICRSLLVNRTRWSDWHFSMSIKEPL